MFGITSFGIGRIDFSITFAVTITIVFAVTAKHPGGLIGVIPQQIDGLAPRLAADQIQARPQGRFDITWPGMFGQQIQIVGEQG